MFLIPAVLKRSWDLKWCVFEKPPKVLLRKNVSLRVFKTLNALPNDQIFAIFSENTRALKSKEYIHGKAHLKLSNATYTEKVKIIQIHQQTSKYQNKDLHSMGHRENLKEENK